MEENAEVDGPTVMSDPTVPLQKALIDKLKALLVGADVFDFVPQTASLPYVTVLVISVVPIDEECWDRSDVAFQIDVWDDKPSSEPVKALAATIRNGLHEQTLAVDGFTIDRMRIDGVFPSREAQTLLNRARIVVAIEAQPT